MANAPAQSQTNLAARERRSSVPTGRVPHSRPISRSRSTTRPAGSRNNRSKRHPPSIALTYHFSLAILSTVYCLYLRLFLGRRDSTMNQIGSLRVEAAYAAAKEHSVSAMNELSRLGHEVSAGQIPDLDDNQSPFRGPLARLEVPTVGSTVCADLLGGPQGYCRFRAASGRVR
jgi:hypothetical protein